MEAQTQVEAFRALLAGMIVDRQPVISAARCLVAEALDREPSDALALMLSADVQPSQEAVVHRVLIIGVKRGHDKPASTSPGRSGGAMR